VKRNKVTPFGTIEAIDQRGAFMGNRGALCRGGDLARPWQVRRWICCVLEFKGWRAPAFGTDGRWTPLFFLDEAVALAAGHRPCALCRRDDYRRWCASWTAGEPSADAMDRILHRDRLDGRAQRTHRRPWRSLPDRTFVRLDDGRAARFEADRLVPWSAAGYGPAVARPARGEAVVLTPSATVDVLLGGY
jgi:hypothetical protein